jgi:hypothetical protein
MKGPGLNVIRQELVIFSFSVISLRASNMYFTDNVVQTHLDLPLSGLKNKILGIINL